MDQKPLFWKAIFLESYSSKNKVKSMAAIKNNILTNKTETIKIKSEVKWI